MTRLYLRVLGAVVVAATLGVGAAFSLIVWFGETDIIGKLALHRGVRYVADELERSDRTQWDAILARANASSPIPWEIASSDTLGERAAPSGTAVVAGDWFEPLMLHVALRDGREQLVFGPMDPIVPASLPIVVGSFIITLTGVAAMLVSLPLLRGTRRLRHALDQLGRGNFGVRVDGKAGDVFSEVAQRLNETASQLDGMFSEREQIMQAVSHELGTPLARIRLQIAMLEALPPDERGARWRALERDLDQIDALSRELVGWVESDRPPQGTDPVDLRDLGEQLMAESSGTAGAASLHFEVDGPHGALVRGDPHQISRALENVIRNATEHATHEVTISIVPDAEWIGVRVDDDGPGVPPPDRTRVFDPFVRLPSSHTRQHGGLGLGLAIVKRIVQSHGGRVALSEAPRGGARVELWWPWARSASGDDPRSPRATTGG